MPLCAGFPKFLWNQGMIKGISFLRPAAAAGAAYDRLRELLFRAGILRPAKAGTKKTVKQYVKHHVLLHLRRSNPVCRVALDCFADARNDGLLGQRRPLHQQRRHAAGAVAHRHHPGSRLAARPRLRDVEAYLINRALVPSTSATRQQMPRSRSGAEASSPVCAEKTPNEYAEHGRVARGRLRRAWLDSVPRPCRRPACAMRPPGAPPGSMRRALDRLTRMTHLLGGVARRQSGLPSLRSALRAIQAPRLTAASYSRLVSFCW